MSCDGSALEHVCACCDIRVLLRRPHELCGRNTGTVKLLPLTKLTSLRLSEIRHITMCCSSMAIYKVSKVSNIKTASLLPRPACATDICHLHKLPKYKLAVICIDCRCQQLVSIVADMVLHTETILWTHTMDPYYGLMLWTHSYVGARRYC